MAKYDHTTKTLIADEDFEGQFDGEKAPYDFKKGDIKIFAAPVADHLLAQSCGPNRPPRLRALDTTQAAKAIIERPAVADIFVCQNKNADNTLCGAKFPVGSQEIIDHLVSHRMVEQKKPEAPKGKKSDKE